MRYGIKVSTFAKKDKKDIIQYLAQYSVSAPLKFKQELERYIDLIRQTPNIFSTYYANPYYRNVVVFGSYVMFYTVNEADGIVFIYRVLHGAQDIENILKTE